MSWDVLADAVRICDSGILYGIRAYLQAEQAAIMSLKGSCIFLMSRLL